MGNIAVICLISLVLLVTACTADSVPSKIELNDYLSSPKILHEYTVHEYGGFTASGGARKINYTYKVVDETVTSCNGQFTDSYRDSTYSAPCNASTYNLLTMSDITKAIGTGQFAKKQGDIVCFNNMTTSGLANGYQPISVYACFDNDHMLVSYGGQGGHGGIVFDWHLEGYEINAY